VILPADADVDALQLEIRKMPGVLDVSVASLGYLEARARLFALGQRVCPL
jgi:hypothetical protein